ncbi:MAG: hypothetical protein ACR2GZ_04640 [Solirubrobacteraceae bacterium]
MSRRPLANLLSASTTDLRAPSAAPARAPTRRVAIGRWDVTPARFYLGLIVTGLIVGALSLLIPSTPSYDPWAWTVWGREIVHIDLQTTGGPSWKPLPMIFTTLFAPFGQAEPDLWLVVARAGAFASVVMVGRLAMRLTRQIGTHFFTAAAPAERGLAAVGPGLLAAAIAMVGLTFTGGFVSDNALGYSEGLAAAAILIAIERHLDGRPRQAFAIAFLAALDRPEIWFFWGPYGLYLWWKDPGARRLIIGLFVLIPVLWFGPEYWGSGHFLRGATRAQHPRSNSPAFAKCPFCTELVDHAWPTVLLRIKGAAVVLGGVVALSLWRRWRREGISATATRPARAQIAAAVAGLLGLAWFVVIAIMTQAGFSGNNRYLVIGSALVDVCGAVGWGWATAEIIGLIAGRLRRRRAGTSGAVGPVGGRLAAAVVVVMALAFVMLPNFIGPNLIDLGKTHGSLNYQARLRAGADRVVANYGGAAKLLRCGTVMTEGFQVPLVAWTLGINTLSVQSSPPPTNPGPAPNVILQTRSQRGHALLPIVHTWSSVKYAYAGHSGPFRLFTHCRA